MGNSSLAMVAHETARSVAGRPLHPKIAGPKGPAYTTGQARLVLQACLGEVGQQYRTVLLLADVDQQPVEEIASLLDISVAIVEARLERARRMVAKALCRQASISDGRSRRAICDGVTLYSLPASNDRNGVPQP